VIREECPGCGKVVRASDEWAGRTGNCPGCGTPVTFAGPDQFDEVVDDVPGTSDPVASPTPSTEDVSSANTMPCPYCREPIRVGAVKCRWCGERLDGRGSSKQSNGWNPKIAGVLSFFVAGAGQLYKGDILRALKLFIAYFVPATLGMALQQTIRMSAGRALFSLVCLLVAISVWGYALYDAVTNSKADPGWWRK
jgi:predicted amidophosphoribosyltransferase